MPKNWLRTYGFRTLWIIALFSLIMMGAATGKSNHEPGAAAVFTSNAIQGQQGQPSLYLALPTAAAIGDTIIVRLMADNVVNLAGFQAAITYDKGSISFLQAAAGQGLTANNTDIFPIGPARFANTVVFGAAACPTMNCTAAIHDSASQSIEGVSGTAVELAAFHFVVQKAGEHDFMLNEAMLVDKQGRPLLATTPALSAVQSHIPTLPELDVSHSGFVNNSDAMILMAEWVDLQKDGRCMADYAAVYDVDGSGCLTVADIQIVLKQWGRFTVDVPPVAEISGVTAVNAAFVVNDSGDASDAVWGDGICLTGNGRCTLRAALEEANISAGPDTIEFDIRDAQGRCPDLVTLTPATSLTIDSINGIDGITIDGYSQCGAAENSNPVNGNAIIKIEIRGDGSTYGLYGLHILTDNNVVRGLAIYDWHRQIRVNTGDNNRFEGNFIGTNAANEHKAYFPGEGDGIRIFWGDNNIIGGALPGQRNIVSGNDQDGINIEDQAFDNLVLGNYVGLKQDGVTALRNSADGIDVAEGAHNNRIGGLLPGERNVIGGNSRDGIEISHGIGNQNNLFVGNFIGLNAAGTAVLGNGHMGVTFEDEINQNQVYRNIIVGNGANGIRLYAAHNNEIYDNFVGVYPAGLNWSNPVPVPATVNEANLVTLPNGTNPGLNLGISGVFITAGSQENQIYTNIIAHHPEYGIYADIQEPYAGIAGYTPCAIIHNTFSRNSIYENVSRGIRLKTGECFGETYYPNEQIPFPIITQAYRTNISGTACPNCLVEMFIADKIVVNNPTDNNGEGKTFIASGTADSAGNFSIAINGPNVGQIVTATATDMVGNTSEFARNVILVEPPVTPTNTPTATATNTPTATATATMTATATNTPTATATATATPFVPDYFIYLPAVLKNS